MEKPNTQLPTIPLTRDGHVDPSHLELIHGVLHGNTIAIKYLPNMLRYANELLANSERRCRSPHDLPLAEVTYGNATFFFARATGTSSDRHNQNRAISAAAQALLRPEWEAMQTFFQETDAKLRRSQDG